MPTEKNTTVTAPATEAPDLEPTSPWNPDASDPTKADGSFMPLIQETAWNTIHYALIDRIVRKHKVLSSNNVAFLVTDLVYEMFEGQISGMMNNIVDMSSYTGQPEGFIGVGDFGDALKAIPIVVVKRVVMKMMKNHSFGSGFLKDLGVAFTALAASNVTGRALSGMTQK